MILSGDRVNGIASVVLLRFFFLLFPAAILRQNAVQHLIESFKGECPRRALIILPADQGPNGDTPYF